MDAIQEIRLRKAVARLINDGLDAKVVTDTEFPVDFDDLFVWEIIKFVRNSAFADASRAIADMRFRD